MKDICVYDCVCWCGYGGCFTVKLVPVEQFLVQDATTNTVQARWASVKGATGYRLTWQPAGIVVYSFLIVHVLLQTGNNLPKESKKHTFRFFSGVLSLSDGDVENINLGDTFNFYMIQGLHPGSDYTITINPIFGDSEGPVTAAKVKTCKHEVEINRQGL